MIIPVVISVFAVLLMAAASAVMDKLWFHYDKSIWAESKRQQFWNPRISWKNKYKADGKTPRFPGATTWLVFLTDGWHLAKTFLTAGLALMPAIWIKYAYDLNWWWFAGLWVVCRALFGAVFHLFFHNLLEKKPNHESDL